MGCESFGHGGFRQRQKWLNGVLKRLLLSNLQKAAEEREGMTEQREREKDNIKIRSLIHFLFIFGFTMSN